MNIYAVKKVELTKGMDRDAYMQALENAPEIYCKGLDEVTEYVGYKLKRGRTGMYGGTVGNTEYLAYRVG